MMTAVHDKFCDCRSSCCEEYADGCFSCSLHEAIRDDERNLIASLIAQEGPWCNCKTYKYAVSLARQGSKAETVYTLSADRIDIDPEINAAYLHINPQDVRPPITTLTDIECNIDIDADGNVVGVEILNWPVAPEKEADE